MFWDRSEGNNIRIMYQTKTGAYNSTQVTKILCSTHPEISTGLIYATWSDPEEVNQL